jgi:rubrerythrin
MEDFSAAIFESAIVAEQAAYRNYVRMAEKVGSAAVRSVILRIADEELVHENLFRKMSLSILVMVNRTRTRMPSLMKYVEQDKLQTSERNDIKAAIQYAIEEEQKAYDYYTLLMDHIDSGEARMILHEIASQEEQHKERLKEVLYNTA